MEADRIHLTALINAATFAEGGNVLRAVIVPRGEFPHRLGLQVVDQGALERMLNAATSKGNIEVSVDYNHASLNPNADPEARRASGWINPASLEITANGLEGEVDWTPTAAEMIRKKEYRYLSPVMLAVRAPDGARHPQRLLNVGLTNTPNIDVMEPLMNNDSGDTPMIDQAILDRLKLPADATAAQVVEAINALVADAGSAEPVLNSIFADLNVTDGPAARAAIMKLQKPPAFSDSEVAAMQNRLAALEGERMAVMVNDAITAGKLAPAQKDWALNYGKQDPKGFEAYLANAQQIVPVADSGTGPQTPGVDPAAPTAEEAVMINSFGGLTLEDLRDK